jgi:hypothetical protein
VDAAHSGSTDTVAVNFRNSAQMRAIGVGVDRRCIGPGRREIDVRKAKIGVSCADRLVSGP